MKHARATEFDYTNLLAMLLLYFVVSYNLTIVLYGAKKNEAKYRDVAPLGRE